MPEANTKEGPQKIDPSEFVQQVLTLPNFKELRRTYDDGTFLGKLIADEQAFFEVGRNITGSLDTSKFPPEIIKLVEEYIVEEKELGRLYALTRGNPSENQRLLEQAHSLLHNEIADLLTEFGITPNTDIGRGLVKVLLQRSRVRYSEPASP